MEGRAGPMRDDGAARAPAPPAWRTRLAARRREVATFAAIWLAAAALGTALPRVFTVAELVENWIADLRMVVLAPLEPRHPDIVLLGITEDTLAQFPYRSPVDRAFLSDVLGQLAERRVRAVGIDLLFDQPSEPAKDAGLRETLRRLPVPVVTGWGSAAEHLTERQLAFQRGFLGDIRHGRSNLDRGGHDGVVRELSPGRDDGAGWTPGFAAAIALALGKDVPRRTLALRYRVAAREGAAPGPGRAFAAYDIHKLKAVPKAWLESKIVLIGADLPHEDRHRTPFSTLYGPAAGDLPGVAIHAHGLAQLLDGRAAARSTLPAEAVLAAVAALAGLAVALLQRGTLTTVLLGLGALAGLWGGTTLAFLWPGMDLPVFAPSVALAASLSLAAAAVARRQRERRRFIRDAFGRYVSPTVVGQLEDDPSSLKLGGQRREVTYVFSDIAGFTGLSETTEPELLVGILNEYLDGMTRVVLRHDGTVDKFIGDAVVALFGAPLDQPDHAARAISCAIDMDRFARGFEPVAAARGVKLGITRIGVHSGEVVVGNFGGDQRFEYTAIGDTVNTASRLEGVNKYLGTRLCISGAAASAAPDIAMRPIGELVLKGKSEPIAAFEPLDAAGAGAHHDAYARAYALLAGGDAGAHAAFRRLAEAAPGDKLARLHLSRLERGESGVRIVMADK